MATDLEQTFPSCRFAALLDSLLTVYKAEAIGLWLYGQNKLIENRRPIDLIREGEFGRVEQLVESLTTGAFV